MSYTIQNVGGSAQSERLLYDFYRNKSDVLCGVFPSSSSSSSGKYLHHVLLTAYYTIGKTVVLID